MQKIQEKDMIISLKRLHSDEQYYNNVFKKTEKIVSVVFYVLSQTSSDYEKLDEQFLNIKDKALKTHEESLKTLSLYTHQISDNDLLGLRHSLVTLESVLRIAEAASIFPEDLFNLISEQIDSVMRYLKNHYTPKTISAEIDPVSLMSNQSKSRVSKPKTTYKQRRTVIPQGDISSDAHFVHSQLTDRSERIKTVLEAKPQATVKDIAEIITDVSEKTIQRELNSLIEKGQVVREGERRWSKYSVLK